MTGTATQSSDYLPWLGAENAIDGNTNGDPINFQRAIAHTLEELAWWKVDLLNSYYIDRIVIWNRTENDGLPDYEGMQARISNLKVSVIGSDGTVVWYTIIPPATYPTPGPENYGKGIPDPSTYPNPSMTFYLPNDIEGQIVKIERLSVDYFWLAEVQVFAVPEPATIFLVGFGLLGLARYGRKKFFKK